MDYNTLQLIAFFTFIFAPFGIAMLYTVFEDYDFKHYFAVFLAINTLWSMCILFFNPELTNMETIVQSKTYYEVGTENGKDKILIDGEFYYVHEIEQPEPETVRASDEFKVSVVKGKPKLFFLDDYYILKVEINE